MRKISFIFLCCILLSLVGCGDSDAEYIRGQEGEVYSKEYKERRTEYKELHSGTSASVAELTTYDESYIIYVKYKDEFSKGHYITYAYYVGKDVYESTEIGSKYLYNSQKDELKPKLLGSKTLSSKEEKAFLEEIQKGTKVIMEGNEENGSN